MTRVRRALIVCVVVGLLAYFILPILLFPSGVWRRAILRDNPLKAPLQITAIRGDALIATDRELRLAGVTLPTDPTAAARATEFLQVITAQGIEIIRRAPPANAFLLRCEPRVWHWCGNDPVAAHYEQFNLNELLVAFGHATPDENAVGLTAMERDRLKAAERLAKERHRGMWYANRGFKDRSFDSELGLNTSGAIILDALIEAAVHTLRDQQ